MTAKSTVGKVKVTSLMMKRTITRNEKVNVYENKR